MKKTQEDELTRMAFLWAEQDRSSLADCWPLGSPERAEAREQAKQLRDYRLQRWGKTKLEGLIERSTPKNISQLKNRK